MVQSRRLVWKYKRRLKLDIGVGGMLCALIFFGLDEVSLGCDGINAVSV